MSVVQVLEMDALSARDAAQQRLLDFDPGRAEQKQALVVVING